MTTPASTPTTRCVAGIPLLCCPGSCFASNSTTTPCWPSKSWTELEIGMEDVTEKIASLMNLCVINDEKKLLGEVPMEIRLVPLLLPLPSLLLFLLSSYPYAPPRVYSSLHRVFLALTVTVAQPQQPQQQSASLTGRGMLTPAVGGGVVAVIFVAVAAFAFILCRLSQRSHSYRPPRPPWLRKRLRPLPRIARFAKLLGLVPAARGQCGAVSGNEAAGETLVHVPGFAQPAPVRDIPSPRQQQRARACRPSSARAAPRALVHLLPCALNCA